MADWRALSGPEVGDLAVRLLALDWSWLFADVPAVATAFGWTVGTVSPYSVSLGTALGPNRGSVSVRSEKASNIAVKVTDYADDDADGRAQVRDAFADMASAITAVLGAPTLRSPGEYAEIRWAGTETTIRLRWFDASVALYLFTNEALDLEDQEAALDEQGLL
ncbi:DUF6301 family protein [Nocardia tengchongensis]|uniref:DUF6301 family protein n=1 Tax=Nocardia tengchongensis TaxID=2055889 RepID=UPI0033D9D2B3